MKVGRIVCMICGAAIGLALAGMIGYFGVRSRFPRPYADVVAASGVDPFLVYAVMKAESNFQEDAVSGAGAVGIMQLQPSTAEFICSLNGVELEVSRLKEGEYNTALGCRYLAYLSERFPVRETALAAYNAGEGNVARWLDDPEISADGRNLQHIPFSETRDYIKKVLRFMKIYDFFYP